MSELVVQPDDPTAPEVRALLQQHLAFAHEQTPPEHIHALDVDDLLDPSVSFFSIRRDGHLLGVGALRQIDQHHAELKSMHTVAAERGRGVGRMMVDHLLGVARARGCHRVSLETGSTAAFAPARALYAGLGFAPCPPFAEYRPSPDNVFLSIDLSQTGTA